MERNEELKNLIIEKYINLNLDDFIDYVLDLDHEELTEHYPNLARWVHEAIHVVGRIDEAIQEIEENASQEEKSDSE